MGYEADLSSHYASVRRRLLGPEIKQAPYRIVSPQVATVIPPLPLKPPPAPPPIKLGLKALFEWVCAREGFSPIEVHSESRSSPITLVRHIFCHLAFFRKKSTTTRIARFLKKDHTTVLHGVRRVAILRERDRLLSERLTRYEAAIDAALNIGGEEHCLCPRCPFRY